MKLTKRSEETSVMDRPVRTFDRFFDDLWRDPFRLFRMPSLFELSERDLLPWHPLADVEETDDAFIVRLDLPGLRKKEIHVSLQDNMLTVRGERKHEGSEKRDDYRVRERFYGKFERTFSLPGTVDPNSVQAEFKDGVLTVHIKKHPESKAKEISIK